MDTVESTAISWAMDTLTKKKLRYTPLIPTINKLISLNFERNRSGAIMLLMILIVIFCCFMFVCATFQFRIGSSNMKTGYQLPDAPRCLFEDVCLIFPFISLALSRRRDVPVQRLCKVRKTTYNPDSLDLHGNNTDRSFTHFWPYSER